MDEYTNGDLFQPRWAGGSSPNFGSRAPGALSAAAQPRATGRAAGWRMPSWTPTSRKIPRRMARAEGGGRAARRAPIEAAGLRFRRPPAVVAFALWLLVEPSSPRASRLAPRRPASAYGYALLSIHPTCLESKGGAEGTRYLSFAPRRGACLVVQSQLAEYGQLKPRLIRAGREVAVPQKLGVAGHAAGDWRPGSIGHPLLHHVHRALLGLYKVDHGNGNRSAFMVRTSKHFL